MFNKDEHVTYTLTSQTGKVVTSNQTHTQVEFDWGTQWIDNTYLSLVPKTTVTSTPHSNAIFNTWYGMPFGDSGYDSYVPEETSVHKPKCECGQRKTVVRLEDDYYQFHSDYCPVYKAGRNV